MLEHYFPKNYPSLILWLAESAIMWHIHVTNSNKLAFYNCVMGVALVRMLGYYGCMRPRIRSHNVLATVHSFLMWHPFFCVFEL